MRNLNQNENDAILPDPSVYEQELGYMPYRDSLKAVIEYVVANAPSNGNLLDLMCGTGYLLGQISKIRKDLRLKGVDLDERYVVYAKEKYPQIDFESGDVLSWKPGENFDVVLCTGSLHHVPYERQEEAVENIAAMAKPEGFVIISDCYLVDYANEIERKIAAAKLGYEYLIETIKNGAPEQVIEATAEILQNDVLAREFKTSLKKRIPIFERFFGQIKTLKTWPATDSECGDYISICTGRK